MSFNQLMNIPAESVILSPQRDHDNMAGLPYKGNEMVSANEIPLNTSKPTAATLRNRQVS